MMERKEERSWGGGARGEKGQGEREREMGEKRERESERERERERGMGKGDGIESTEGNTKADRLCQNVFQTATRQSFPHLCYFT